MLFTANQHAREHLTVEMALYLAQRADTDSYATDAADHEHRQQPRDLDRPDGQPGRRRVRHRHRLLPHRGARTASPTRARARSAPTSTATGASSGAAAAARQRHALARRPTAAPSAFSAPETAARARLRQLARDRRRPADQGRTSTSTPTPSWSCGRTATRPPTRRPALTADDQRDAFATLGQNMAAHQRLHARAGVSDLYIADGTINDWLWGAAQDLQLHVRDVPDGLEPGLLSARRGDRRADDAQPRGGAAAARGRRLPVPRDRQAGQYCGGGRRRPRSTPTTSRPRPAGRRTRRTDTATTGRWERGDPAATTSSGAKQLGTTVSGVNDLVTGAARRRRRRATNDVDGGVDLDHARRRSR